MLKTQMRGRPRSVAVSAAALLCALVAWTAAGTAPAASRPEAAYGKPYTIGVSHLGLSFPFPAAIKRGMEQQARKLGVKLIQVDAQAKAEKQANDIQDLLSQNVDGLLIGPINAAAAVAPVRAAIARHVPAMAFGSKIGTQKNPVYPGLAAFVSQREEAAGAAAGRLALKAEPNGARYALVLGQTGFEENRTRVVDFLKVIKASGKPWKQLAAQPGDWTRDKAQSACQNLLAAHSDIQLFYALSDDMGVGCADAIRSAGSKAKVIGIGGSRIGLAAIKRGALYGTIYYSPETMGRLAITTMVNYLNGKKPKNKYVTYTVTPVTKSNVGSVKGEW